MVPTKLLVNLRWYNIIIAQSCFEFTILISLESDYEIHSALNFTMSAMSSETKCFSVNITDDLIDENEEQFELYFLSPSSNFATIGDPSTLCVSIIDNDCEY